MVRVAQAWRQMVKFLDEVQLESKVRKKGRKYRKVPMLTQEASECRISQLLSRLKGTP